MSKPTFLDVTTRRRPWIALAVLFLVFLLPGAWRFAFGQEEPPPEAEQPDARVQKRDQLWDATRRLGAEGKLGEAVAAGEELLALQRELSGETDAQFLAVLEWLAWLHERREDLAAAKAVRSRVLSLREKMHGAAHWRVTDARLSLAHTELLARLSRDQRRRLVEAEQLHAQATALSEKGQLDDALKLNADDLAIRREILGREHTAYANSLHYRGVLCLAKGQLQEAAKHWEEAVAIYTKALTRRHPVCVRTLVCLAAAYGLTGRDEDAERLFREALQVGPDVLGREDPDLRAALDGLVRLLEGRARLHLLAEQFDAACQLYRDVVEAKARILGREHWQVADARCTLQYAELVARLSPDDRRRLARAAELLGTALKYHEVGYYLEALMDAKEAAEIHKQLVGEEHPVYANDVALLGVLYDALGHRRRAETLLAHALSIYVKALGGKHPLVAQALNNLGMLYLDMADYQRAERLLLRAVEVTGECLGEESAEYGLTLNNLGLLYSAVGRYDVAEALLLKSLVVRRQVLGENHPDCAGTLHNLAGLYRELGDYSLAERLYEKSAAVLRKKPGEKSQEYAQSLHAWGAFCVEIHDYARARPLLQKALEVRGELAGEQQLAYAQTLDVLGALHQGMGDLAQAEKLFRQSLAICERLREEAPSEYATCLNNLGACCYARDQFDQAEAYYRQAVEVEKQIHGEQHPDYAIALGNLAVLCKAQGDYQQAEELYRQVLAVYEAAGWQEHPHYARTLNNLGEAYRAAGDLAKAEPYHQQAAEIYGRSLGREHPLYAVVILNRALLLAAAGDFAAAEPLARQGLEIRRRHLERLFAVQSERQQLLAVQSLRGALDGYLWIAPGAALPAEQAYQYVLSWKGAVFARQRQARMLRGRPDLLPQWTELQSAASRLAALVLATPQPQHRDAWRRQVDQLSRRVEELEMQLAQQSEAFHREHQQRRCTPADVQTVLPDGTILVDVLEYLHRTPAEDRTGKLASQRRLAAFLVRKDAPVVRLDLGPADAVASAVDRWRARFGLDKDGALAAAELRGLVWEPLEPHLGGIHTVLLSPDGALARFPLPALPGKTPGTYLLEKMRVAVVPVPRLLPELLAGPVAGQGKSGPAEKEGSLLLVGNVDFNADPGRRGAVEESLAEAGETSSAGPTAKDRPAIPATSGAAVRPGMLSPFQPTSGFRGEFKALNELYRQTHPDGQVHQLQAAGAIEDAVRQAVPGNRYVHLITHAFFAPPEVMSALSGTAEGDRGAKRIMTPSETPAGRRDPFEGLHPGLLSGIALAGANRGPQPIGQTGRLGDDGILTALETASLDLSCAELVVLSACETGLGEVAGGEGLLGLQRAFQVAGARTVVASLWKVDDAATEQLMIHFYRNLWQKKGLPPLEALRQAQLAILNGQKLPAADGDRGEAAGQSEESGSRAGFGPEFNVPEQAPRMRASPRLWAAWVLSGAPGSLAVTDVDR